MRSETRFRHLMLAVCALTLAGCSHEAAPVGDPFTRYAGSVLGYGEMGTVALTIVHPGTIPMLGGRRGSTTGSAAGTLRVRSGFKVVRLLGTYDTATHVLALSGEGWTLGGTYAEGVMRGRFTSPDGHGAFIAQQQGAGAPPVTTYCGMGVACLHPRLDASLGIHGSTIVGLAQRTPTDTVTAFSGSLSPVDSSIVLVRLDDPDGPPLGTGRLYTNSYTTWAVIGFVLTPGDTCGWSGQTCP